MRKLGTLVLIAAAVSVGCGKKKTAPAGGSGSATGGAGIVEPAAGSTPVDKATGDRAAAGAAVMKAGADATGSLAPSARAETVGKLVDATVAAMRRGSRDAWDPAAVVAAVGSDRKALFTWVRDHTALVPYRGSLRGAVGVLMDRVGNSLDRALLLAALLERAGLTVRLANATLDADASGKLAASWSKRARPAVPVPVEPDPAFVDQLAALLHTDAVGFRAGLARFETARADVAAATGARAKAQLATLGALVPGAAPPPASADADVLSDHWWVQVQDGDLWSDLDPSLPDASPGEALAATATQTIAPGELADDRRHTLTVRVIGEIWHDQAREELTLLDHTFAPSQFYGQRIAITTVPIDMPAWTELAADPHPAAALRAAITSQTEWIPLMTFGGSVVAQRSVTDGGETFDLTDPNANTTRLARVVQRATKQGVGGATDVLGQLPDDPSAGPPPAKPPMAESSGFTAEWIEYELRAPGEAPRVSRRLVFDALGGADRANARPVKLTEAARLDRGLALTGDVELLPMFAGIPEAFVLDRAAKALEDARPALVELLSLGTGAPSKELQDRILGLTPTPGPLYSLALARSGWSPVAEQVYLDRLDLLVESKRLVAAGANLRVRDGFDIVANAVAAWPSDAATARTIRMTQGVVDTIAEAVILRCPAGASACVRGVNASDELAAASAAWVAVTSATAPDLARITPAARAVAAADLTNGYALVVPPGPGPAATWWRIDPTTGESLGMGALGGTAGTEEAILNAAYAAAGGFAGAAVCVTSLAAGSTGGVGFLLCMAAVAQGLVPAYAGLELKKHTALMIANLILTTAYAGASAIVPADP